MNQEGREAFRAYVAARSPSLLRTAYLLTGSTADAEDLLQTALAKTYLAWDRIREREAVDGYVRRVMTNAATSQWRRRRPREVLTDAPPEQPYAADLSHDVAARDAIWAALGALPAQQRATIVLRYYEQLSPAETAHTLGVSVGTVKSTTARALARLRSSPGLLTDSEEARTTDGATA